MPTPKLMTTAGLRTQRSRGVRFAVLCVCMLAPLVGCKSSGGSRGGASKQSKLVDPAPLVERFNSRTGRITSLWARASAVIEGEDAQGRDLRERAEGHFQIIPPDRVAMSLGKVGNTNLYFGSDDTFYWWFDMIDGDRKVATIGRHEFITPDKIDALGLPIDPLNLIDTLGITPLPENMGSIVARRGSEAGTVVLSAPTRRGVRRYTIDEETAEPSRVELIGPGGVSVLDVALSRYRLMKKLDPDEAPLRVPGRVVVRMDGFNGEIRFDLNEPERKNIRAVAFRVDQLIEAYGITALVDLDQELLDRLQSEPMEAGDLP